jgi:threonine dehydratase
VKGVAPVTPEDVRDAADRIGSYVRRTPLWETELQGRRLLIKAEQLQRSGSFKLRGAVNAVLRAREAGATGVACASGGNHGLGLATAAVMLGMRAQVHIPRSTPEDKLARVQRAGAQVVVVDGDYQAAAEASQQAARAADLVYVPAYDHPDVIAGQGTCALEVMQERPDCEAVVVAVGGGGLLAGTALAVEGRALVVGAEPRGIPTVTRALEAGHPVEVEVDSLTANALGARITGQLNLEVLQSWPPTMTLLDDDEILAGRDLMWEEFRLAVEPAVGAAVSAALSLEVDLPCVVLCGANSGWTTT